jgi:hypothetical protein
MEKLKIEFPSRIIGNKFYTRDEDGREIPQRTYCKYVDSIYDLSIDELEYAVKAYVGLTKKISELKQLINQL